MKKTIYVDWDLREVLTEKDFQERVKEERKRLIDDDEAFEEWLEECFTMVEIWQMGLDERIKALNDYREYCDNEAKENLLYKYDGYIEEFEIEI